MSVYLKNILWVFLVIISACNTKLPNGMQACSDEVNTDCYVKLVNKKECFIHLDTYSEENNIAWSGTCVNHLAESIGTLSYKQSPVQTTTVKGTMKQGKFVGKRNSFTENVAQKFKINGIVTDTTMSLKLIGKNGISITGKYQKSTECEKLYVECWKGTFSRFEDNTQRYLVGYMYAPKPYKGKSIMYGVLYWKNTCTEVEWKRGEYPLPKKLIVPPLIDAVKKIQYSRVKSLLTEHHPVNFPDKNGRTPLMYAVSKAGFVPEIITALLLKHGADIKKKDKQGKTVYDYVTKKGYAGNFITMLNDARDGT